MNKKKGFALIELMIVVAIVAILITIAIGALNDHETQKQREPAPADQTTIGVHCVKGVLMVTDEKGTSPALDENNQPATCSG